MPYPKLVTKGPEGESLLVEVEKDVFTIGRGPVEIRHRDGSYYIQDPSSQTRNFVNGVEVEPQGKTEIQDGDVITIADLQLRFLLVDA